MQAQPFAFDLLPQAIAKLTGRDLAMVTLCASTGIRPCEIPALQWRNLCDATGKLTERCRWITRKKGGVTRDIALSPSTIAALEAWRAESQPADTAALLFPGIRGAKLSASAVRVAIISAMRRAGMDASGYSLRHAAIDARAKRCAAVGGTAKDLGAWSGHRDDSSVLHYLNRYSNVAQTLDAPECF
jgi:integrase